MCDTLFRERASDREVGVTEIGRRWRGERRGDGGKLVGREGKDKVLSLV